jgi:hypothetical protein
LSDIPVRTDRASGIQVKSEGGVFFNVFLTLQLLLLLFEFSKNNEPNNLAD